MERFKKRNLLIAAVIYLTIFNIASLAFRDDGRSGSAVIFLIIYSGICFLITAGIIRSAKERRAADKHEFKKNYPFNKYGSSYLDFQHLFSKNTNISNEISQNLKKSLSDNFDASYKGLIAFTDVDKDIEKPESKDFEVYDLGKHRDAYFRMVVKIINNKDIHIVRWWLFYEGSLNPNKVFLMYMFSPLTAFSRLIPAIKNEYNPLATLQDVYASYYNLFDFRNTTKSFEHVALESYIKTLEDNGVDTSDLKLQRAQMLNVTIAGGNNTIGNIVQGVANKFSTPAKVN